MKQIERLLVVALIIMALLAVSVVFVAPRLRRDDLTSEQTFEPGETETMLAEVIEILEEDTIELGDGSTQPYQRLLLRVKSGTLTGEEVVVEEGTTNIVSQERLFSAGDRVYLERAVGPESDRLYISDFVRTGPLLSVIAVFIGLVILVGRGKGLRSLIGSAISLAVIFAFILPQIMAGRDPVTVSVIGSIILLGASTYITYGWNPKTHAAVVGMMLSLVLTGLLAWIFVFWTRLTGLSVEEGAYLVMELGPDVKLRGLVLGGIIIGSLGVLDDICVGQASAIFELVNANRDLELLDLFRRSLNIGRDHIAAMVNTLLLAYMGSSMQLMLVFTIYQEPIWRRINREPIAEEIVRTLVGSTGLIMAVPITSLIASLLARRVVSKSRDQQSDSAE